MITDQISNRSELHLVTDNSENPTELATGWLAPRPGQPPLTCAEAINLAMMLSDGGRYAGDEFDNLMASPGSARAHYGEPARSRPWAWGFAAAELHALAADLYQLADQS